MKTLSADQLRKKRSGLARQLARLQPHWLRGSLIERYKRCGKPGCGCAKTRGHGPKFYLSVSHSGQLPQMDYVPQEHLPQVRQYVANHQKAKALVEEISQINRELFRRREPF